MFKPHSKPTTWRLHWGLSSHPCRRHWRLPDHPAATAEQQPCLLSRMASLVLYHSPQFTPRRPNHPNSTTRSGCLLSRMPCLVLSHFPQPTPISPCPTLLGHLILLAGRDFYQKLWKKVLLNGRAVMPHLTMEVGRPLIVQ